MDTKTVNAYVTGFLASKRIVLWDTLLARLDEREVLFVMGHEMGHYVLHHVLLGIAFYSLLAGSASTRSIALAPLARSRAGAGTMGFARLDDVASLPLLLLLLQLGSFAIMPAALGFSRWMEHEADRFGLELTQDSHAAALAFVKLQQNNLSHPAPGPALRVVARLAPVARRPHRLRERVPAVGGRRAAPLRRPLPVAPTRPRRRGSR